MALEKRYAILSDGDVLGILSDFNQAPLRIICSCRYICLLFLFLISLLRLFPINHNETKLGVWDVNLRARYNTILSGTNEDARF